MAGGLGSIQNTLQGMDPLTLAQALADQQAQDLAAQTQQATQAASQAGQQYQQAAQQPTPQLDPFSQLIPALFGNVASVLSQNPVYQQEGQQQVQQSRAELLRARADNLAGLMQTAKARAEAAQKAGDVEAEAKARTTLDSIHQKYDMVKQNADHAFDAEQKQKDREGDLAVQRLRNEGALAEARLKAGKGGAGDVATIVGADPQDFVEGYTKGDGTTVPILKMPGYLTPKAKTVLGGWAKQNGIVIADEKTPAGGALTQIQDARANLQYIKDTIIPKLSVGNVLQRGLKAGENVAAQKFQTDPILASYPAFRSGAIQNVQTLASLGKGLRINQAEINAVQQFDFPPITDSQETAKGRLAILDMFLNHLENAALGHPPTNAESARLVRMANAVKAGRPIPEESGSSPKADAMKAARTGDTETLRAIVTANPNLNNDPDLLGLVRKKK